MKPRQIVQAALDFQDTPRTPRQLWTLSWPEIHHPGELARIRERFPDDIKHVPPVYRTPPRTSGNPWEPGTYVDEWGCPFENCQRGQIGEVKTPPLSSVAEVLDYPLPEELLSLNTEEVDRYCAAHEEFHLPGAVVRPFERLQFLCGSETVFVELLEEPEAAEKALRHLHEFHLKELEVWARTKVDGLFVIDDWGSQNALLISPDLWRKLFKPLYADYAALAHQHGKRLFMHSDGYILPIMEDLIEAGVDAINSQVFCMGVEELGRRFRGRITFWGEIDRQSILPHPSREPVERAVDAMWEHLRAPHGGGVIAQCEFGLGARPENVWRVFERWEELDAALVGSRMTHA